jgi:CheY-like chemotaxis protein
VLIVEDEPYLAEAVRDGLRLEAIAADIAGDGDTALELLSINAYDIAVLDRDIPGPSERIRTDHAGLGLGLAIVKSITQAHDGTLTLTPRTAGGFSVTVQLPAAPANTGH